MATKALAPPSPRRLQLQFNEFWLLLSDARRQNEEVLRLISDVNSLRMQADTKRLEALNAIKRDDIFGAARALFEMESVLNDQGRKLAELSEVEQRDVKTEFSFRNLFSLMEKAIKGWRQ